VNPGYPVTGAKDNESGGDNWSYEMCKAHSPHELTANISRVLHAVGWVTGRASDL